MVAALPAAAAGRVSPELAAARGIPVRLVGVAYLLALALAVALSASRSARSSRPRCWSGRPPPRCASPSGRSGRSLAAAAIGVGAMWLGIAARLRQLLLAAAPQGWPVSFFVVTLVLVVYLLSVCGLCAGAAWRRPARWPARRRRTASARCSPASWSTPGSSPRIVAVVAGAVGFFIVMRGSAFVAHAMPNGSFAGAAGASLIGAQHVARARRLRAAGALGIGLLGRRGRHDVATALALVLMLGLGALFLSFSVEYAPAVYSLLFGEVLGISDNESRRPRSLGVLACSRWRSCTDRCCCPRCCPSRRGARRRARSRSSSASSRVVALATTMTVPVVGTLLSSA